MVDEAGNETRFGPQADPTHRSSTAIPASAVVRGSIQTDGDVRVDGLYEGPIDARGSLVVGKRGRVLGSVVADSVSIAGALKGNVTALHVQVLDTGHVWGDLTARSVVLAPGGTVNGQIVTPAKVSAAELFAGMEPITPSPVSPQQSLEPQVLPASDVSRHPTVRPHAGGRLRDWLWTYGLAIPLILLVIAAGYIASRGRFGQSSSPQLVGRSTAAEARSPTDGMLSLTATLPPTLPSSTPAATSEPEPTSTPALTATVAVAVMPTPAGGRVVEVGLSSVATLNPLLAGPDDDLSRAVGGLLFDSLLQVDPRNARVAPALAQGWEVSSDGRTFVFHLRRDVTWHDGQPFTAADVQFTLSAASDPAGPSAYRSDLAQLSQVDVLGGATVAITLQDPNCDAIYAVGDVPILPRHVLEGEGIDSSSFGERPVGTGPFAFASRDADGGISLSANEHYWAGRPRLDGWAYHVVANTGDLERAMRSGEAQFARLPEDLDAAPLSEACRILPYPAGRWHALALNTDHPLLSDVKVRRALAMALDREGLLSVAVDGHGTLMEGPWLGAHWVMVDDPLEAQAYALDQAHELLGAAGWHDGDGDGLLDRDGEPLRLSIVTHPGSPVREQIALLTQHDWRAAGISAQVEIVPWGILLDELFGHTFAVAVLDWPLMAAPDQTWLWSASESDHGGGFNFVSYADARADDLLRQGRTMPGCEPSQRAAVYRDLGAQLMADQPYVFLFASHQRLAVVEGLVGPQPGPYAGLYWNVAQWTLSP